MLRRYWRAPAGPRKAYGADDEPAIRRSGLREVTRAAEAARPRVVFRSDSRCARETAGRPGQA